MFELQFMPSPVGLVVGLGSPYGGVFTYFVNMGLFDYTDYWEREHPVNRFNHTSWMTSVL